MADHPEIERAIRSFQSGADSDAGFRLIHRTYHREIHRFFSRQGFNELSEDLTQETLLRVYRKLRDYEHRGCFSAWLFDIAKNISRDERRRRYGTLKRSGLEVPYDEIARPGDKEEDGIQAPPLPSKTSTQEEEVYEKERRAILDEAIQDLAPRQRECLTLRMLGHTYDEIAILVQISRETVKQHLTAARKKLQQLLGGLDLKGLNEPASG